MLFVKINNRIVVSYPLSLQDICNQFPQTSFPADGSGLPEGFFKVVETPRPQINTEESICTEGPVVLISGEWSRSWVTTPLATEALLQKAQEKTRAFQADITNSVQQRLDVFAQTRNYDGILSACTYATSTIPKFATEGGVAVKARDATWATLYALMGEVQAGTRPMPTDYSEVAALLPLLEWPV